MATESPERCKYCDQPAAFRITYSPSDGRVEKLFTCQRHSSRAHDEVTSWPSITYPLAKTAEVK